MAFLGPFFLRSRPVMALCTPHSHLPPQVKRRPRDDEPEQSYWKVANGIRLTGMPGFRSALAETQMWQVSLLVANAHKLPKSVHDMLDARPVPNEAAE